MRLIITGICVLLALSSSAQFTAGVKAGMNLSSQRYLIDGIKTTDGSSPRVAFHAGLAYEKEFRPRSGFQADLIYSLEGAREGANGGSMSLSYLKLPLLLYYMPTEWLRLAIGPEFAYLLNARANSHGFGTDRRDAYESMVFNAVAGAEYLVGSGWRIGVRYSLGLSDFLNREFYTFDIRSKTDTFQLYSTFVFNVY